MKYQVVCPGCGMSTWKEGFGCCLPGCDNYGVQAVENFHEAAIEKQGESEESE